VYTYNQVIEFPFLGEYLAEICIFDHTGVDGCTYEFMVGRDPFARAVLLDPTPISCPGLPTWAPYVIAAAAVVAIFLIGLILICLVKFCVVVWVR